MYTFYLSLPVKVDGNSSFATTRFGVWFDSAWRSVYRKIRIKMYKYFASIYVHFLNNAIEVLMNVPEFNDLYTCNLHPIVHVHYVNLFWGKWEFLNFAGCNFQWRYIQHALKIEKWYNLAWLENHILQSFFQTILRLSSYNLEKNRKKIVIIWWCNG